LGRLLVWDAAMKDGMTDIEWVRRQIERAGMHAGNLSDDIHSQDALRLTGTVMRLDRIREALDEAWRTLQLVYDDALARERALNADRTVSGSSDGSVGVVADILGAAAAGFRPSGSDDRGCRASASDVG